MPADEYSAAPPRSGIIILAAGESSRLGQPKQLVRSPARSSLLENTVTAALAAPLWPVVVVLGAHRDAIRPQLARFPVLIADNDTWASGMASSIRTGLETLLRFSRHVPGAIITPCDQPHLAPTHFVRLLDAARLARTTAAACHYADRPGAPAWFAASRFNDLLALTGDQGARALLRRLSPDQLALLPAAELAVDIDTPEDLAAFTAQNRPRA